MGFGRLVSELICQPLRLESIELAEAREQFSKLHWPAAAQYDPAWVYHGCLTGTARDALQPCYMRSIPAICSAPTRSNKCTRHTPA